MKSCKMRCGKNTTVPSPCHQSRRSFPTVWIPRFKLSIQSPFLSSIIIDNRHDKNQVISPFAPQNVSVDPSEKLPALQEQKKDETRHKPRISLYRWLGQHQEEEERRVTFKTDEKQEKEPVKETKDTGGMEAVIQNYIEPKVSSDETREYER